MEQCLITRFWPAIRSFLNQKAKDGVADKTVIITHSRRTGTRVELSSNSIVAILIEQMIAVRELLRNIPHEIPWAPGMIKSGVI